MLLTSLEFRNQRQNMRGTSTVITFDRVQGKECTLHSVWKGTIGPSSRSAFLNFHPRGEQGPASSCCWSPFKVFHLLQQGDENVPCLHFNINKLPKHKNEWKSLFKFDTCLFLSPNNKNTNAQ